MAADLHAALAAATGRPRLWRMRNGHALPDAAGLAAADAWLAGAGDTARDALRARLRLGLHRDVEPRTSRSTWRW